MSAREGAEFAPRLDILPRPQRKLWDELGETPPEFTLYGASAVALQLGHRQSVDFDFISRQTFDHRALRSAVPFLAGAQTVQSSPNRLTVSVDRGAPVLISFIWGVETGEVAAPVVAAGSGLRVAALIDLAAQLAVTIQNRAEARDFVDFDALLTHGLTVSQIAAAGMVAYGERFSPTLMLRAATRFDAGNLHRVSDAIRQRLRAAALNIGPNALAIPPDTCDGSPRLAALKPTPALEKAAARCLWFEPPREALADTARLAAYILTYGDTTDVDALREELSEDDLREALDSAPPGVFDARSWAYWNFMVGRLETPPMPVRRLE